MENQEKLKRKSSLENQTKARNKKRNFKKKLIFLQSKYEQLRQGKMKKFTGKTDFFCVSWQDFSNDSLIMQQKQRLA